MADLTLSISAIQHETDDVISVHMALNDTTFPFVAGQFVKFSLAAIADPRGPSRFFSLASSPTEKELMIVTKISESPFKQKLAAMLPKENVTINGPFGKFTLGQPDKHYVFTGGGIGITPFRSMIKYATDMKLPHRITLLYSNKTPEDILFQNDFYICSKTNPNLTIIHTITRPQESKIPWVGKTGRIDESMIREYVNDLSNTLFYVCGPPSMAEALYTLIKGLGVIEENLKIERFTGYQ